MDTQGKSDPPPPIFQRQKSQATLGMNRLDGCSPNKAPRLVRRGRAAAY